MRNPVTLLIELWVNLWARLTRRSQDELVPVRATVQDMLRSAHKNRRRDEPLSDICLHDFDPTGGPFGRPAFGCHRPATSNRLLCGKHAAQHDRVKRDRARKKRARAQQQKARRS